MNASWFDLCLRCSRRRFGGLHPIAVCCLVSLLLPISARSDDPGPLKVFVLAGQSNMQGHAHIRTLDAMRWNSDAAPLLESILDTDEQPRVCERVWISSIGSSETEKVGRLTVGFGAGGRGPKIGPELMFGIRMEDQLDEPILLIKSAWGGKSLHTDFRPPGAGEYRFNEEQLAAFRKQGKDVESIRHEKADASGRYYRLMIDHVKHVLGNIERVYPDYDADRGYELAGFVWFQGWNDMVDRGVYPNRDQPGGYDGYSELLTQFIRDVRNDLSAPELPFVIGVMGVGGPTALYGPRQQRYTAVHQNFRDAMAAPAKLPQFQGNVAAVLTEDYWDMRVVRLREKEQTFKPEVDAIRQAIKQKQIDRGAGQEKIDALYQQHFTAKELEILRQSTSNFDFHYMGSAGVMAQIGAGFADAMVTLLNE